MKNHLFGKIGSYAYFGLALLLVGCANTTNPLAVADATQVTYDQYTKTTTVLADMVQESDGFNNITYRLRAGIKGKNNNYVQLYLTYWSQSGWYFLSSADDINGESLPVVTIDSQVESGAVRETLAVTLSRPYLDSHKLSGMNIRITGKRGSITVQVPSAYIAGFLTKLDTVPLPK